MTKDAKYRFLSKLERLAEELYRRGDSVSHDDEWEKQRSFMYGFCDSGKTISLVTQEDIQRVIDKAHKRVYGEERLARKERLKPLEDESGEPDWDAFDSLPLSGRVATDANLADSLVIKQPSSQTRTTT